MSRDQIPLEVLAHEIVEFSKTRLPKALVNVLNAYCRRLGREKSQWLARLNNNPELMLSPELQQRWVAHPALMKELGRALLIRPEAGIWAFDRNLKFQKFEASQFLENSENLQAMNPGSAHLMQQFFSKFRFADRSSFRVLDLCAAPGAKLIWSALAAIQQQKNVCGQALEQKYPRFERLKENLRKFKLDVLVSSHLHTVGEEALPPEIQDQPWDLILVDLPCSGSGTLSSRPDLLQENLGDRVRNLKATQLKILETVQSLQAKSTLVSVCSVDPEEIAGISELLRKAPDIESPWMIDSSPSDGLRGWIL